MYGGPETDQLNDVESHNLARKTRNNCIYAYRLRITMKSLRRQQSHVHSSNDQVPTKPYYLRVPQSAIPNTRLHLCTLTNAAPISHRHVTPPQQRPFGLSNPHPQTPRT